MATIIRKIPKIATQLVAYFEGFSPTVYVCAAGVKTVGYGHALKQGEDEKFKNGITEEEGRELLEQDMLQAGGSVYRLTKVSLSEGQYAALISFCFNLGGGAYQRSTLRSMLNREEYLEAADEFPKWCWGGGKRLAGLYKRRIRERQIFLS